MAREQFEIWKRTNQNRIHIYKGIEDRIELQLSNQLHTTFPINKNEIKDLTIDISATNYLEAPVEENQVVRNPDYTNK